MVELQSVLNEDSMLDTTVLEGGGLDTTVSEGGGASFANTYISTTNRRYTTMITTEDGVTVSNILTTIQQSGITAYCLLQNDRGKSLLTLLHLFSF